MKTLRILEEELEEERIHVLLKGYDQLSLLSTSRH